MSSCDPDFCWEEVPQMDGCLRWFCLVHDADRVEVVRWDDGADGGWLCARGTCTECDGFWTDVDVNTAFYAEKSHGVIAPAEPAPSLVVAKGHPKP